MEKIKYIGIFISSIALLALLGVGLIHYGYDFKTETIQSTIAISIGTSLLASLAVILMECFRNFIKDKYYTTINNVVFKAGVSNVYDRRDIDEYHDLISKAKRRVLVTGYSLNAFYDSHAKKLADKKKEYSNFDLRIILVDPESEFSKNRALNEDRPPNYFIDSTTRLKDKQSCPFEVRTIKNPLTTMIFCIDDTLFVGPHLHKTPSKSTLTMKISKNGWLHNTYLNEFEALWQDSTPLIDKS